MKYQAINVEYMKALKEYDNLKKDVNLFLKGIKYGYLIFCLVFISILLVKENYVLALDSTKTYEWQESVIYNDSLPDSILTYNQKNQTINSGFYNGTYSFTDQTGNPTDWTITESGGANIEVISEKDGHKDVLFLDDVSGSYFQSAEQSFSAISGSNDFSIEFWLMVDAIQATDQLYIRLYGSSTLAVHIILHGSTSQWSWYDSGYNDFASVEIDTWIHWKIVFNINTDTYDIYLNGIQEVNGAIFDNIVSQIDKFYLGLGTPSTQDYWIDAIGYSWDSDYYIGLNTEYNFTYTNTLETDKYTFGFDDSGNEIDSLDDIADWTHSSNYLSLETDESLDNYIFYDPSGTDTDTMTLDISDYSDTDSFYYNITFKQTTYKPTFFYINIYGNTAIKISFVWYWEFANLLHCLYSTTEAEYPSHTADYTEYDTFNLGSFTPYDEFPELFEFSMYLNNVSFTYDNNTHETNCSEQGFDYIHLVFNEIGGGTEWKIDDIAVQFNGNSTCSESYPSNIFVLGFDWNLENHPSLELTFDNNFDNNISILVNGYTFYDYQEFSNVFTEQFYNNNSVYSNVYLQILNSTSYSITNIRISGISLIENSNTYYCSITSSNVNTTESYFYISGTELHYYLYSNNSNTEYIQLEIDIDNELSYNSSISFSHAKTNSNFYSQFRVYYSDNSYSLFSANPFNQGINEILPQTKTIDKFILLITDNDELDSGYNSGYIRTITLKYIPDLTTSITTTNLFSLIPAMILLILIPLVIYIRLKDKKYVVPTFVLMNFLCLAFNLIPIWIVFLSISLAVIYYLTKGKVFN